MIGKCSEHSGRLSRTRRRAVRLTLLATLLLIGLTIAAFAFLPRYQPSGVPLLPAPVFASGLAGWQVQGEVRRNDAGVILENRDPAKTVYLRRIIELPPGRRAVRLRAEVATRGVRPGDDPWETARIYLAQLDPAGRPDWNQPHNMIRLAGDNPKRAHVEVFDIPEEVDRVLLSLSLTNATGRLEVAGLDLLVVEETPLFRLAGAILVGGWCLLTLYVAISVYRSIGSVRIRVWLVAMFAMLVFGVFMSAALRQQMIDNLASGLGFDLANPDALGHGFIFMMLAFLVRVGRPRDPLWLHLISWLLVGVSSEVLQLFTADRVTSVDDFSMDVIGVAIGLALAATLPRTLRWLEPKRRSRRPFG